jgi:hypothetical protein
LRSDRGIVKQAELKTLAATFGGSTQWEGSFPAIGSDLEDRPPEFRNLIMDV